MSQNLESHSTYHGFYMTSGIWVESMPDFNQNVTIQKLPEILSKTVFLVDTDTFSVRACKDGLILFKRKSQATLQPSTLLKYLNVLALILESTFRKFNQISIPSEAITVAHLIQHVYDQETLVHGLVPSNSMEAMYQYRARFLNSYIPIRWQDITIDQDNYWTHLVKQVIPNDPRIRNRTLVLSEAIWQTWIREFSVVADNYQHIRFLNDLHFSLSQYTLENYALALIQAWFLLETLIFKLYDRAKLYRNPSELERNTDEITVSQALRLLRDKKIISTQNIVLLHKIRTWRNQIAHNPDAIELTTHDLKTVYDVVTELLRVEIQLDIRWS